MKYKKGKGMRFYYDQEADVVYFSKGKPSKEDSSREVGEDVVMRFNSQTGQITGLTILNFSKRTSKKPAVYNLPFDIEMRPPI